MVLVAKHDFHGKKVGEVSLSDDFFSVEGVSAQSIKDYIVAIRANKRQWSANTKGRSEVSHSTKKPFRQKGTGNARQGSLAAPQFRGGGIVFGPKPKFDQFTRINKKERRTAVRYLLGQKIKEEKFLLLEDACFASFDQPKTKRVLELLNNCKVPLRGLLFVDAVEKKEVSKHFKKGARNLAAYRDFVLGLNLNAYDIIVSHFIIFSESALEEMTNLLLKGN